MSWYALMETPGNVSTMTKRLNLQETPLSIKEKHHRHWRNPPSSWKESKDKHTSDGIGGKSPLCLPGSRQNATKFFIDVRLTTKNQNKSRLVVALDGTCDAMAVLRSVTLCQNCCSSARATPDTLLLPQNMGTIGWLSDDEQNATLIQTIHRVPSPQRSRWGKLHQRYGHQHVACFCRKFRKKDYHDVMPIRFSEIWGNLET